VSALGNDRHIDTDSRLSHLIFTISVQCRHSATGIVKIVMAAELVICLRCVVIP